MERAHNLLAKLYLQSGQNREAIEESRKALNIDPKDQAAVYHLIQALRKTGDKPNSLSCSNAWPSFAGKRPNRKNSAADTS